MKCAAFLVLFIMLLSAVTATGGSKVHFLIRTQASGDKDQYGNLNAQLNADVFESEVRLAIKDEFPCTEVRTVTDLKMLLSHERDKQLLGVGDDNTLSEIGQAFGCEYLVSVKVHVVNKMASYRVFIARADTAIIMARIAELIPDDEAGFDAMKAFAKKLVEQLKEYEICPFRGPVKVEVVSKRNSETTEEYMVYCNEMDHQYKKIIDVNEETTTLLDLLKVGREHSSGYMKYLEVDSNTITEENGCYKCPSGREGGRISKETIVTRRSVEDFSEFSTIGGKYTDDIRIRLIFLENGTYMVRIKGASKKDGTLYQKYILNAQGTCDNKSGPPEISEQKGLAIPCNFLFGPYPGRAYDKSLSGSYNTIISKDDQKKEQTVLHIEFNLKHE